MSKLSFRLPVVIWILKRAPTKFFQEIFFGGKENLLGKFLTKFFKKTWKFPNKKGTFAVNLVFIAIFACTKRALFITKRGTFGLLKKFGGHVPLCPPGPYTPAYNTQKRRLIQT
jgi:hypothetical protein